QSRFKAKAPRPQSKCRERTGSVPVFFNEQGIQAENKNNESSMVTLEALMRQNSSRMYGNNVQEEVPTTSKRSSSVTQLRTYIAKPIAPGVTNHKANFTVQLNKLLKDLRSKSQKTVKPRNPVTTVSLSQFFPLKKRYS